MGQQEREKHKRESREKKKKTSIKYCYRTKSK